MFSVRCNHRRSTFELLARISSLQEHDVPSPSSGKKSQSPAQQVVSRIDFIVQVLHLLSLISHQPLTTPCRIAACNLYTVLRRQACRVVVLQLLSLCWSLKLALSLVCRSIPFALILRTLSSRSTPIYNQQQPAVCELLHRTHTTSSQRASSASLKAAVRSLTQTRPSNRQHGKCRPLPLPLHLLQPRCSNSRTIVAH